MIVVPVPACVSVPDPEITALRKWFPVELRTMAPLLVMALCDRAPVDPPLPICSVLPAAMLVAPVKLLLSPRMIVVPPPERASELEEERTLRLTVPELLTASVPAPVTLPMVACVAPPLPICSVPALMVVRPV